MYKSTKSNAKQNKKKTFSQGIVVTTEKKLVSEQPASEQPVSKKRVSKKRVSKSFHFDAHPKLKTRVKIAVAKRNITITTWMTRLIYRGLEEEEENY